MTHSILNPKTSDALDFIEKYHKSKPDKTLLIIIGDCMIDYRGRARSFLDWGDRVIMIKQDGAVLVHQPIMREPVNWQPSGSKTNFSVKDDLLILKSHHTRPPEKMKIAFRNVKLVPLIHFVIKPSWLFLVWKPMLLTRLLVIQIYLKMDYELVSEKSMLNQV